MTQIPNDPDEDEIKHILESMWEMTSRDERDERRSPERPRAIEIDIDQISAPLTHAPLGTGSADAEPWPRLQIDPQDSRNGEHNQPKRRRLIDALDDVESAKPSGLSNTSDQTSHQQLSSLSYQGDGKAAADSETAMRTQSGNNNDTHLNGSHLEHLNGNSHDILNGDHQAFENHSDLVAPLSASNTADPAPVATTMAGDDAKTGQGQGVKRQMGSFVDNRMNQMGSGAPASGPATSHIASAPAPSPVEQPPQQAAREETIEPSVAATPAVSTASTAAEPPMESAAELMRPVLRQWLGENMPKIVESALQIEAAETAHSDDTKKPDK